MELAALMDRMDAQLAVKLYEVSSQWVVFTEMSLAELWEECVALAQRINRQQTQRRSDG